MKFISSILTQARGSLGGTVYSRNRGGAYTRNRSRPVQPLTALQIAVRLAVKQSANLYATALTASQRAGWAAYAASNPQPDGVGGTMTLSAIAMFNKVNVPLIIAYGTGQAVLDGPGAVPFLAALSAGPTMDITAGVVTIDLINSVDFAIGDILFGFVTKSCSAGRTPVHQPSQPIGVITLTAVPTTPTNYTGTGVDPFAVSRSSGSGYQMRWYYIRGANISSPLLFQGITG